MDRSPTVTRRTDRLVIRTLDDETLVYDLDTDEVHCLTGAAAAVFAGATANATVSDLVTSTEYGEPAVLAAAAQLDAKNLLLASGPGGLSRRSLLQRGAIVGGAALVLPAIESIFAPSAALAASCDLVPETRDAATDLASYYAANSVAAGNYDKTVTAAYGAFNFYRAASAFSVGGITMFDGYFALPASATGLVESNSGGRFNDTGTVEANFVISDAGQTLTGTFLAANTTIQSRDTQLLAQVTPTQLGTGASTVSIGAGVRPRAYVSLSSTGDAPGIALPNSGANLQLVTLSGTMVYAIKFTLPVACTGTYTLRFDIANAPAAGNIIFYGATGTAIFTSPGFASGATTFATAAIPATNATAYGVVDFSANPGTKTFVQSTTMRINLTATY